MGRNSGRSGREELESGLMLPDSMDFERFLNAVLGGNKTVHVAEVVRHGDAIQLPEGMSTPTAIDILMKKMHEEEEVTEFRATIPVSPYDGAYALKKALERKFGFATQKDNFDMFGRNNRSQIQVVVNARGNTVTVPWGVFEVPGIEGRFETSYDKEDGRVFFSISAEIKGKHKLAFEELVELTREIVAKESIYRGNAISIDDFDSYVPTVKFIDVETASRPIFSDQLEEQLDNDLLAYIRHADVIRSMRGSIKRGVLLAGTYGTGKTLTAKYVAHEATTNGITFLYAKSEDLTEAIDFVRQYLPAVIFVEDIERVAELDRTEEVNELLNKVDGVNTKNMDLVIVYTTNHRDRINPAMFRPGRIDTLLRVDPPDASAAIRLVRNFAGDALDPLADLSEAGKVLSGVIPATIEEAVSRARIRAVTRSGGHIGAPITLPDLISAAESVRAEHQLDSTDSPKKDTEVLGEAFANVMSTTVTEVVSPNGRKAYR